MKLFNHVLLLQGDTVEICATKNGRTISHLKFNCFLETENEPELRDVLKQVKRSDVVAPFEEDF